MVQDEELDLPAEWGERSATVKNSPSRPWQRMPNSRLNITRCRCRCRRYGWKYLSSFGWPATPSKQAGSLVNDGGDDDEEEAE